MSTILDQLKKRRKQLGLTQADMLMRVGISRQQYQQLESKGNPRLDTLELVARGLQSELLLIPKEKLALVLAALKDGSEVARPSDDTHIIEDPWQELLGDIE